MIKYFTMAYLARYYIQTETQLSIYHGPAGPAYGMGCVQAEKARAQDVPNLENLVKQISENAAGEFFSFPFRLVIHLRLQVHGYNQIFCTLN